MKIQVLQFWKGFNKKLKEEKINTVTDIQQVYNIWKMRNLTLDKKIVIFKTIVISKIVF